MNISNFDLKIVKIKVEILYKSNLQRKKEKKV